MEAVEQILTATEDLRLERLTDELKEQAAAMGVREARHLVFGYYQIQDYRKAAGNQVRRGDDFPDAVPMPLLEWAYKYNKDGEKRIASLLAAYAAGNPVGTWSLSICGIGPIISAGLLAHIDITKAPTVGNIWRYAGLDPTIQWLSAEKAKALVVNVLGRKSGKASLEDIAAVETTMNRRAGVFATRWTKEGMKPVTTVAQLANAVAKRPWNAELKTLCWKIGESFVNQQNNDKDVYGAVYVARKALEQVRNDAGEYAEQAEKKLATTNIGKDKTAYKCYSKGQLPPAHIHRRAQRVAVKLFLAHWHHVAYECHYNELPPKPYVIDHGGHRDFIGPPNWPMA